MFVRRARRKWRIINVNILDQGFITTNVGHIQASRRASLKNLGKIKSSKTVLSFRKPFASSLIIYCLRRQTEKPTCYLNFLPWVRPTAVRGTDELCVYVCVLAIDNQKLQRKTPYEIIVYVRFSRKTNNAIGFSWMFIVYIASR